MLGPHMALLSVQDGGTGGCFNSLGLPREEMGRSFLLATLWGAIPRPLFDILLCSYKTDIAVILCVTLLDMFSIATEIIGGSRLAMLTSYLAN